MYEKLRKNSKSDKADTLVIFFLTLPFLMILIGISVNSSSSINSATEFKSIAQNAVEVAVKEVNAQGSLGSSAVEAFRTEYRIQSGDSAIPNLATTDTRVQRASVCETAVIDGVERQLPYIQVRLETARGAGALQSSSWILEGRSNPPIDNRNLGSVKYPVISATAYTSSANVWNFPGIPECQLHKAEVSAITFGNNSDIN